MNGAAARWADRNGAVLVAVATGLLCAAYLTDAVLSSTRIHNLIMLVPLTAIAILLMLVVLVKELAFRRERPRTLPGTARAVEVAGEGEPSEVEPSEGASALGVASMMAGLVVYAFAIPWTGFEVASAVFMAFCLYVQGERRWMFLGGFSLFYAWLVTWLVINLARIPVPTMVM